MKKVEGLFLADRVLTNQYQEITDVISVNTGDLNSYQHSFLLKAARHDISFLWGPPGTGKTKCLGALVAAFYQAGEKSAVVSNTNKAVDQVLLKLSNDLILNGREEDLEAGRIIRLGTIHHEQLESEFGHYLNLDLIVEKKGEDLRHQADQVRERISEDTVLKEHLDEVLRFIDELVELSKEAEYRRDNLVSAEQTLGSTEKLFNFNLSQQAEITKELREIHLRGVLKRLFSRSAEQLNKDLDMLKSKQVKLKADLDSAKKHCADQQRRFDESSSLVAKAEAAVHGKTRQSVEAEQSLANAWLREAEATLSKLLKDLESLKERILSDALVVGSTLTKVSLTPGQVGKYDNLIVDEASMAMPPAIHFAASQAKKRVVISGDFRQLPPIVNSDNETIYKRIGRDIFITSGVGRRLFEGAELPNAGILQWQYRMPDDLCQHISEFAYGSRLRSAPGFTQDSSPLPLACQKHF